MFVVPRCLTIQKWLTLSEIPANPGTRNLSKRPVSLRRICTCVYNCSFGFLAFSITDVWHGLVMILLCF